jgi:hypothetical protein
MKVKIESPGPLDVDSFVVNEDNGVGVEAAPYFYDSGKEGTAAVLRVFDDEDKLLSAARLVVDGTTGKLRLQDRTAPTKSRLEQEKEAAKLEAAKQAAQPKPHVPPLPPGHKV